MLTGILLLLLAMAGPVPQAARIALSELTTILMDCLPAVMVKYLEMTSPNHSYIHGDFEMCPVEPDVPGHLRRVCMTGAAKVVVQDVRGLRPRFRILSTWPAAGRHLEEPARRQVPSAWSFR
jgi:hypothetical protein